jgi:hypothetical protein
VAQARGLRSSSRRLGDWRLAPRCERGVVHTGPLLAVAREAFTHSPQVWHARKRNLRRQGAEFVPAPSSILIVPRTQHCGRCHRPRAQDPPPAGAHVADSTGRKLTRSASPIAAVCTTPDSAIAGACPPVGIPCTTGIPQPRELGWLGKRSESRTSCLRPSAGQRSEWRVASAWGDRPVSGAGLSVGFVGSACWTQVAGTGSARSRAKAWASACAQRQLRSILSRSLRPPRTSRAATCSSR